MEDEDDPINRCLRDPILVYESTSRNVPVNLKLLLSTFNEHELTQSDHLVLLAYTLMVEMGFLPSHLVCKFKDDSRSPTFNINYLREAKTMPENYKHVDGVYKIDFALPTLPAHVLCLTAQTSDSIVVFTAWLRDSIGAPSWCIALDCNQYVMKTQTEFMSHRYFNLKSLSIQFKNRIPLPARSYLKFYGNVDDSCLLNLPEEMKIMILSYITHQQDIINLSKTCVSLHEICRSKILPSRPRLPLFLVKWNQ